MDPLAHRIEAALMANGAKAGATLLVAVSGGADSLCLLHALHSLQPSTGVALHVAHLDHTLRGDDSAADAAFVVATAAAWGLPCTAEAANVAAEAVRGKHNLHDAARRVRYAFLARIARHIGASAVLTAHTANDQAETVLLHLLRGAGTAGLSGMRPLTPWESWAPHERRAAGPPLIRPLLGATRTEIERYCAAHGLQPRADATNADVRHTRSRIRHELLPGLIEYNPHILEALGRTAQVCADDADFLDTALDAVWPALAHTSTTSVGLRLAEWRGLHPALQRAALRRAYRLLGGEATVALEQIERARALIAGGVGRQLPLAGGVLLTITYDEVVLGAFQPGGPQLLAEGTLEAAGGIALADGWAIEVWHGPAAPPASRWEVCLNPGLIQGQLRARGRRPGDRLRPAGGRGSRKIQDVLVDAKVPQPLRDRWPLLADDERIVWVAGVRAAEGVQAQPPSEHGLWIRVTAPNVE